VRQDCIEWNKSLNHNWRFEKRVYLADLWLLHLEEVCARNLCIARMKKCIYEAEGSESGLASHQSSHHGCNLMGKRNNVQAMKNLERFLKV
jgi:hypothetical protein